MSIHYMLPNDFPFSGLSSFPWKPYTRGILLGFGCSDTTLAHEIGHYFGLLHTFNEEFFESDLVDDTPKQSASKCEGEEGGTPNCKNILSYCDHFPKCVTPGQIKRMRRFLRASRTNHLASNEPESIFVSGLPQVQTIDVFNP